MSVSNPRLATQATVKRENTPSCLALYRYNSLFSRNEVFDPESETWSSTGYALPSGTTDGEVIAFLPDETSLQELRVWVSGQWVPARIVSSFVNPDTGKDWDPLQNF